MTERLTAAGAPARAALALLGVAGLVAGCATSLTQPATRPAPDFARPAPADSAFRPIEETIRQAHGAEASGFRLLDRSEDALLWRLALADSARNTLDLQYYIWSGDDAGLLLANRVVEAANRGVQVRIIIDDLDTLLGEGAAPGVRDKSVAMLHSHPNIRIRLFNAWKSRSLAGRSAELVGSLQRLNRRMHNKQMIADNTAAIVGGRNIADEYMGLDEEFNFKDLDVLGVGPVAREASAAFDRFWNSDWVLSVTELDVELSEQELQAARENLRRTLHESRSLVRIPVDPKDWSADITALPAVLAIGTSRVVTDSPDHDAVSHHMPEAIRDIVLSAEHEVLFTNAYVIPGEKAIAALRRLTDRGVTIRMLTNSLASQDVPAVNAKYKKWRKPLIEAGVELHELRPDATIRRTIADTPPVESKTLGLHTKAIVVDRKRVFIGSMNLDPRSFQLNSEMGVVIESPDLAEKLAAVMDRGMLPENSWRVELDPKGDLRWVSGSEVLTRQPALGSLQRLQDFIFQLFPKEYY